MLKSIICLTIVSLFINSGGLYPQNQYNTNIQEKTAIVITNTADGNIIEFSDRSGGWYLETDERYPNFEEGQILRLTVNTMGTSSIEDDELIEIESLGFIDINENQ